MAEAIRILILEDNAADTELVQFELQEAGIVFTPKVVLTEEGYVQALHSFCPDLILSDYDLPKYNGLLALAEARRTCPDTPFILVTGAVTEDRAIDILTQGAKDYVLKNRLPQRLAPAVRRAIAEAQEQRARKQAEAELHEAHRTLEKQVDDRTSELRESKERLSLALTSSGMGTFEWDLVRNKRYFDDYVYFLLGIKPESFSGKAEEFFQAIHEDDRRAVQAAQIKTIERGAPYETEYRVIWPDGSVHHIAARGKVLRDDAGRPFRMIGVCWEITEHRRTEEKLRRFELLAAHARDVVLFIRRDDGRVMEANAAAVNAYGHTREELLALTVHDLRAPDTQELTTNQLDEAEKQGILFETRHRRKDGTLFPVEVSSRGANIGGVRMLISVIRDITERKLAEEKEIRHNKIIEAINRIFHEVITCETEEQLGNVCLDVIETLTGSAISFIGEIGPDNLLHSLSISKPGRESCAMIDPASHGRPPGSFKIHGLYGRVLKDGKSLLVNEPAAHPDSIGIPKGHPPLKAFLGVPLIQDGKTIGMIGVGNRVGGYTPEHQQTLETLAPVVLQSLLKKRTELELRTSETRYRTFFESAMVGTAELSMEGRFLRVNHHLCQMTGYSVEELLRMSPLDLSLPEDAQHNRDELSAYLQDKMPVFDVVRRYRQKSGNIIWVHVTANMIRDANAKPLHSVGIIIDISKRIRAEEALKQHSANLEAINKELELFSFSVSHDLRAPLRAIEGYSRMIFKKEGDQFGEETQRQFQLIRDNANAAGRLIEDLLDFSRLTKQDIAKRDIDMEEIVGEVWQELVTINPDREMTLKIGPISAAYGDRTLVKQIYGNLLGNAVKFTRGRTPAVIEAGSAIRDNEAIYYVRDNGVGFDMKFYDKLFGLFQRLHSDEEYEGTGIGLALVQRIINRHGGQVWAESKIDEGTTVYFTLPRKENRFVSEEK